MIFPVSSTNLIFYILPFKNVAINKRVKLYSKTGTMLI
jgi:hypothetical protein